MTDTTTFNRQYRKYRKNLRLTPELLHVLDALPDESASAYVEAAAWSALISEFGEEAVTEAIEDAQTALDSSEDDRLTPLADSKQYEIEITG